MRSKVLERDENRKVDKETETNGERINRAKNKFISHISISAVADDDIKICYKL